jgi:hypothetical protein
MPADVAATSLYVELTRAFNAGRTRAVISSGQAVVLHRITMQSKDGDWLVREDEEACSRILAVLAERGAHYRYGAPLHPRWLAGGWSAHLEFAVGDLRLRTDFVSRPPRLAPERLARLWSTAAGEAAPVVGMADLIALKQTDRERDYVIIGALAERLADPEVELEHGRDPERLVELLRDRPDLPPAVRSARPWLTPGLDVDAIAVLLDAERRTAMRRNRERLDAYGLAAARWREAWPQLAPRLQAVPLAEAHANMVEAATRLLPEQL